MSLRVLIVEDETLIALHLVSILEDNGHAVIGIATTMASALDIARANPAIDLAVMDVDLAAGPDGVETARRLRQDHDVASLFVSATLTEEVRARAAAWHPVGFISKPFGEREIVRAISGLSPRPAT